MDKRLIKSLEGYMAIPEITKVLALSRARVHQLIEEDKFEIDDMRVAGDKRMVLIKNAAVYAHLASQEDRAARLAADHAAEEKRLLSKVAERAEKAAAEDDSSSVSSEEEFGEPVVRQDPPTAVADVPEVEPTIVPASVDDSELDELLSLDDTDARVKAIETSILDTDTSLPGAGESDSLAELLQL